MLKNYRELWNTTRITTKVLSEACNVYTEKVNNWFSTLASYLYGIAAARKYG